MRLADELILVVLIFACGVSGGAGAAKVFDSHNIVCTFKLPVLPEYALAKERK